MVLVHIKEQEKMENMFKIKKVTRRAVMVEPDKRTGKNGKLSPNQK